MSVNSCTFIGNVGKDPEVKTMNNGEQVANLSLACSEKWTAKSGEKKEKTEWINVVVFGKLCKVIENYVKKGSKLYIRGKLTTRKWEDQSGQTKYMTEIVVQGFGGEIQMLDSRGEQKQEMRPSHDNNDLEDIIPF